MASTPGAPDIQNLRDYIQKPEREPLVGLERVMEYRVLGQGGQCDTRYFCDVCDLHCELVPMIEHLASMKHRKLYLSRTFPHLLPQPPAGKEERKLLLRQLASDVEKTEGIRAFKHDPTVRRPTNVNGRPGPIPLPQRSGRLETEAQRASRWARAMEYLQTYDIESASEVSAVTEVTRKLAAELQNFSRKMREDPEFYASLVRRRREEEQRLSNTGRAAAGIGGQIMPNLGQQMAPGMGQQIMPGIGGQMTPGMGGQIAPGMGLPAMGNFGPNAPSIPGQQAMGPNAPFNPGQAAMANQGLGLANRLDSNPTSHWEPAPSLGQPMAPMLGPRGPSMFGQPMVPAMAQPMNPTINPMMAQPMNPMMAQLGPPPPQMFPMGLPPQINPNLGFPHLPPPVFPSNVPPPVMPAQVPASKPAESEDAKFFKKLMNLLSVIPDKDDSKAPVASGQPAGQQQVPSSQVAPKPLAEQPVNPKLPTTLAEPAISDPKSVVSENQAKDSDKQNKLLELLRATRQKAVMKEQSMAASSNVPDPKSGPKDKPPTPLQKDIPLRPSGKHGHPPALGKDKPEPATFTRASLSPTAERSGKERLPEMAKGLDQKKSDLGPDMPSMRPDLGPDGPRRGPEFGPDEPRRGPEFGPDGPRRGPEFGPDGPRRGLEFGPDGPRRGPDGPEFGPDGLRRGPDFGPDGPRRGSEFGPDGPRRGPDFGPDGPRRGAEFGPDFERRGAEFERRGPGFGPDSDLRPEFELIRIKRDYEASKGKMRPDLHPDLGRRRHSPDRRRSPGPHGPRDSPERWSRRGEEKRPRHEEDFFAPTEEEQRLRHGNDPAPNLSVDLLKRIRGKDMFTVSAILSEYGEDEM